MSKSLLMFVVLLSFTLVGCETIQGAGRDIQNGGQALERAVD